MKYLFLILAMMGCVGKSENPAAPVPTAPTVPPSQVVSPETMDVFVMKVMDTCKAQMSEVKRKLLAEQIARISTRFAHRQHQEAFVLLICIESKFNNSVRSKVGALGLTQVMPKYAAAFAEQCGLGKLDVRDMDDAEVNLTVGACYFNQLLAKFEGNVTLALAGYNSGPDSSTTKNLKALREGHPETMGYVAKFAYLRETLGEIERNGASSDQQ